MSPILAEIGGVRIYYYGLAYAFGFVSVNLWVLFLRRYYEWSLEEVYDFSICFTLGVLLCGRAFDIAVYEWDYYRGHLSQILNLWGGGMATHGVLLGAIAGTAVFCGLRHKNFLAVTDRLAMAACLFMAIGRIGNHINGEVYGYATDLPWAVKFPYVEGYRHPVAIYDGLKNLFLIPILLYVRGSAHYRRGLVMAHFVFWYAFLRFLVDFFRDYDSYWLGIGRGQYFNLVMAVCGLGLVVWVSMRKDASPGQPVSPLYSRGDVSRGGRACRPILWFKIIFFYSVVISSLAIPSGWTHAVLEIFRKRSGT